MPEFNKNEYNREYNKTAYKTVKVYIPIDEYEGILEHMKTQGYSKMSGYIKALIDEDMKEKSQE